MKNDSGFVPLGDKVLIKSDQQPDQNTGLIQIPDHVREKHLHGQMTGVLVAVGDGCARWWQEEWLAQKLPIPGERIVYARYAGLGFIGKDGAHYRALNARDVTGWAADGLKIE